MSKVDLHIRFDQADRVYHSGQKVTGSVTVVARRDVVANNLVLEQFWRTHGRGNRAQGGELKLHFPMLPMRAGEEAQRRFELLAPSGPPTYHGHYLNVDHYVRARLDVPWAFDPKVEEEYFLLPGRERYDELPIEKTGGRAKVPTLWIVIGCALALLFCTPIGLLIAAGALLYLGITRIRRHLVHRKLGPVTARWDPLQLAPGQSVKVHMKFRPKASTEINGVHLLLTGSEVCVSGSGSDRTTHKHTLFQQKQKVDVPRQLHAGKPVHADVAVHLPHMNAYSFQASDNDLRWEAELRIDMPMWPDWVDRRTVVVCPPQLAPGRLTPGTPPVIRSPVPLNKQPAAISKPQPPVKTSQVSSDPSSPGHKPGSAPAAALDEAPDVDELISVLDELEVMQDYGTQRNAVIASLEDQLFACDLEVEHVERTFGRAEPELRSGRTLHGLIHGTAHRVVVFLPETANEAADLLRRGSRWRGTCRFVDWSVVYTRAELQAVT